MTSNVLEPFGISVVEGNLTLSVVDSDGRSYVVPIGNHYWLPSISVAAVRILHEDDLLAISRFIKHRRSMKHESDRAAKVHRRPESKSGVETPQNGEVDC